MNKIFDHSKARIAAAGVVAAILLILTGLAVKADGLDGLEAGFRHSHQPASGRQSSDPEGDPFSETGSALLIPLLPILTLCLTECFTHVPQQI